MASPFFSGRIPQDLYDRIEQHTKETGESKTKILINALSQYLGYELPVSNSSEVASIKTRLTVLESAIKEIQTAHPKSDRYQMSILDVLDNTDNTLITEIDSTDNKLITDRGNTVMILTSKEVTGLTGIARRTFEDRHRSGKLPISKNGYTIFAHAGKQSEKPFANLWEVITNDNTDNN